MQPRILGIIGGGQMAEAIVKGLLDKNFFKPQEIIVSEPVPERRKYLVNTYKLRVVEKNSEVIIASNIILLAVKPQVMKEVLEEIRPYLNPEKHLLITIAAGLPISFYKKLLPGKTRLIRVMPNTCALVQKSISAISKGEYASEEDLELTKRLFSTIGEVVEIDEKLMDGVTALSGSGPAYVALFVEALVDAGVRVGLPRPLAEKLALFTLLGSAELMFKTQKNPYELKSMVTSPGGTTIAALEQLYKQGFPGAIISAVYSAYLRSRELSELFK